jgi:hypothetical protein
LTCRLVWKRMGKEDRFGQYRQANYQCANKLRQSPLAHLKPPRPKTKARYMNVASEIRWGRRALWLLDRVRSGNLNDRQKKRLDRDSVEGQLGWLDGYREDLGGWSELCEIGRTTCAVVRDHGYSQATVKKLTSALGPGETPAAQELITELTSAVEGQCTRCAGISVPLPGSSEVIESLIGKGKRLLGTSQNNNSLTRQILSIAASTVKITVSGLLESMQRCRISDIQKWSSENISEGIHVARCEDLSDPKGGTKPAQPKIA